MHTVSKHCLGMGIVRAPGDEITLGALLAGVFLRVAGSSSRGEIKY